MARSPTNYLRTERQRHSLTQGEVGKLLGLCRSSIGKYENDERIPTAILIVAGEVIFGKSAAEMFPAFYRGVQEAIGANALILMDELEGLEDEKSLKKQKLLADIPGRTTAFDL